MRPQDIVALMLAATTVLVLLGLLIRGALVEAPPVDGVIAFWSDTTKIVLGGLIGYMAGGHRE